MKAVFVLLAISCILLGIGLVAPTMMTEPKLVWETGDFTEVFQILFPEEFTSASFSILDGVSLMWGHGSKGIATVIFVFSVLFPVAKLLVLWFAGIQLMQQSQPGWVLTIVEKLGKFSMVDVFVIAVLIVTIEGLPFGSKIHAQWGLYVFAISVITSMFAGAKIGKQPAISRSVDSTYCHQV